MEGCRGLNSIRGADSFDEFKQGHSRCEKDTMIVSAATRVTSDQVDSQMIEVFTAKMLINYSLGSQPHTLQGRIPTGLIPAMTSSYGDCLFGTVSMCLLRTIQSEQLLRFAAVIHGIHHFDHYIDMVSTFMCYNDYSVTSA